MGVSDNLLIRQPKFLPNRLVTGQQKTVASLRGLGKNGPGKNGPGKNGPGKNGPEKTVRGIIGLAVESVKTVRSFR